MEVTPLDLPRLDDGEFLNDTVIDFYIRSVLLRCGLLSAVLVRLDAGPG